MDLDAAKARLIDEVDKRADLLLDASHRIHEHPELGYEEVFAHELLTGIVEDEGLSVERGAYGLDTAFAARAGSRRARPSRCAASTTRCPASATPAGTTSSPPPASAPGLAAAALADELGGRVVVLGTPAEEGGGGKVKMIERGAFEGVDAAMMVHPAGGDLRAMNVIAVQQLWVTYHGQAAHAAAFPYKGRNALDAAVLGYMNVAALRQHIRPEERIHGIITDGGDKPNIVPARVGGRVVRPGRHAAPGSSRSRTGCSPASRPGPTPPGARSSTSGRTAPTPTCATTCPSSTSTPTTPPAWAARPPSPTDGFSVVGSTDMGNVSYEVPSIHPMIKVSPPHVSIHTPEFATYAGGPEGDEAVLDGAKALAMTIADLWLRPGALEQAVEAFQSARGGLGQRRGRLTATCPPSL